MFQSPLWKTHHQQRPWLNIAEQVPDGVQPCFVGRLTRLIYEQEVIPRRFEIDDITSRDLLHAANVGRLRPLISLGVMSLHQNKRVCIFLEEGSPETPLTSRNTRWLVHERPASSACLMINFSRSLLIFRFGPSVIAIRTHCSKVQDAPEATI